MRAVGDVIDTELRKVDNLAALEVTLGHTGRVGESPSLRPWGAEFSAVDNTTGQRCVVGSAEVWTGYLHDPQLTDAADEHSGDLQHVAASLVRAVAAEDLALQEVLCGELLIVDRVVLAPACRRRGLGPLFVAELIEVFGSGIDVVACHPMPLPEDDRADDAPAAVRLCGQRKLQRTWRTVGFVPLATAPEVYVLPMALVDRERRLAGLRSKHTALVERLPDLGEEW